MQWWATAFCKAAVNGHRLTAQSAIESTTVTMQLHTIARQQDEDERGLQVKRPLANANSILQGVLHCLVATLMPHRLRHCVADVSDAALGALIQ